MTKTEIRNSATKLISFVFILLPAVFALLYVRAFGVSVVFADAWSMVRLFDKWDSGTLLISDLFAPHNEHRMFFPKGVELLLGIVTKYDTLAEMYLIQGCFLVTLVILFLAFRSNAKPWPLLFVPISLLVFSFRQYENMLFGFQVNFAFTQTFGVLALFLLHILGRGRFKRLTFVAALGSATVASFSTAQGLFVWPVGLLQLITSPVGKRARIILIAVWGSVGLGEWVAYFTDYARPEDRPSLLFVLDHPAVGMEYFLNLLGSSLFWQQSTAFVGGLFVACLALVSLLILVRGGKLGEHSFWIALLLYSLFMLATITLGRSGVFGVWQALAPRYTTFSVLAVASVYAMLAITAFERRSIVNIVLLVSLCGVVLYSAAISYSVGTQAGGATEAARERAALVLLTYNSRPNWVLEASLGTRAKVIRERAPVLQRLGYNVFSGPPEKVIDP